MRRLLPAVTAFVFLAAAAGCGDPDVPGDTTSSSSVSSSAATTGSGPVDMDGDGFTSAQDCDDTNPDVYPGAVELCDGLDNDCDKIVDNGAPTFFLDADHDGYGSTPVVACASPGPDYVLTGGDCNDADAAIHPGATEVCDDGVDNDCDGSQMTGCGPCQITVPTDQPTIVAGLAAAAPGDRVCVLAGTYAEHVVMPSGVELVGVDGAATTTIQGDGVQPVVKIPNGSGTTLLRGFTITGGHYQASTAEAGGVEVTGGAPVLDGLVVEGNFGSGVRFDGSTGALTASVLHDNTMGFYGGGIQIWGGSNATVDRVEVYGNDASRGGGIYVNAALVDVSHAYLHDNDSAYGGGLYVEGAAGVAKVSNVIFAANTGGYGAAMNVSSNGSAALDHVVVLGNTSTWSPGLWSDSGGTVTGDHVIFAGGKSGPEIYEDPGSSATLSHAVLYKDSNSLARMNMGGTIALSASAVSYDFGTVADSVTCWNAPCVFTGGGTSALANVNIQPNVTSSGFLPLQPAYLDSTPVDPLQWNLHLVAGSALVDALPGELDPDGSPGDIGPYGGPGADAWDLDGDGFPSWWQPGPYDSATYPALNLDCNDLDPAVYPGQGC